jgi:hypothetical protein
VSEASLRAIAIRIREVDVGRDGLELVVDAPMTHVSRTVIHSVSAKDVGYTYNTGSKKCARAVRSVHSPRLMIVEELKWAMTVCFTKTTTTNGVDSKMSPRFP